MKMDVQQFCKAPLCFFILFFTLNSTIASATDMDDDGMDDDWEQLYGLNNTLDDAMLDLDQDGYTNLSEFLGGTYPDDIRSSPSITTRIIDFEDTSDLDVIEVTDGVASIAPGKGMGGSNALALTVSAESRVINFSINVGQINEQIIFHVTGEGFENTAGITVMNGTNNFLGTQIRKNWLIANKRSYIKPQSEMQLRINSPLPAGDTSFVIYIDNIAYQTLGEPDPEFGGNDVQLVSRDDANNPITGASSFIMHGVSADGNLVLFQESQNELDYNNLYLRNMEANQTTLVHEGYVPRATLSADGSTVIYNTRLVQEDLNVFDVVSGTTELDVLGASATFDEGNPLINFDRIMDLSISADGRLILFTTRGDLDGKGRATNQNRGGFILYTYDRLTTRVQRQSVGDYGQLPGSAGNGQALGVNSASISADGRFIAYESYFKELAEDDDLITFRNIFLRDRKTNDVIVVGRGTNGNVPSADTGPALGYMSLDGSRVHYHGAAADFAPEFRSSLSASGPTIDLTYDVQTGSVNEIEVETENGELIRGIRAREATIGQRYVVFEMPSSVYADITSNSITGLFYHESSAGGGGSGSLPLFRADLLTGEVKLASLSKQGNAIHTSRFAPIHMTSADGRYVIVMSSDNKIAPADALSPGAIQLYRIDLGDGNVIEDIDADGTPNYLDAFPNQSAEQKDNDWDGMGNNADWDDDNDWMSDQYESMSDMNPLDPVDGLEDINDDGVRNFIDAVMNDDQNIVKAASLYTQQGESFEAELDLRLWQANQWGFTPRRATDGNQSITTNKLPNAVDSEMLLVADFEFGAQLVFSQYVDTEVNADVFIVKIDDVEVHSESGFADWQDIVVNIPAGKHVISFVYSKNEDGQAGNDGVWLDNFRFEFRTEQDIDSDADGVADINDNCPLISNPQQLNSDFADDGGDACDADDDNDGFSDVNDAFPVNLAASLDTDEDGLPNQFNNGCDEQCRADSGLVEDLDDDNDGVLDNNDIYPLISLDGLTDTDGDGAPNDCDAGCVSLGMQADNDDDNDGVPDVDDAYPLDPTRSSDTPNIVTNDSNGDGYADILWRNQNDGRNWLWTMNGRNILQSGGINTVADSAWQIVGRGDFDGEGKSDILWRNRDTGRNYIYLMDGFSIAQQGELNYVNDANWQVKGVADFDGDGKDDVIWRHATQGRTWIYLMNGMTTKSSQGSLTVADLNWEIVASGDVNGDDKADVIWRHKTRGDNYVWLMNGTQIANRYVLNRVASSDWTIAGAGDIDGDGTDDIIWRNQFDGRNWAYLMNDGQIQTSSLINGVANLNWQIADISDLNGDGKADLFWRQNQSGESYIYLMNGVSISSRGFSKKVNPQWKVIH